MFGATKLLLFQFLSKKKVAFEKFFLFFCALLIFYY